MKIYIDNKCRKHYLLIMIMKDKMIKLTLVVVEFQIHPSRHINKYGTMVKHDLGQCCVVFVDSKFQENDVLLGQLSFEAGFTTSGQVYSTLHPFHNTGNTIYMLPQMYVEFLNSSYRKISRHSSKHRFTIMRYVGDAKLDAWC
ncbi:hypothetical protein T4A_6278 [Trichinella pseudospiralis]|uniref:Uncharacterized protein n=1 Tax=Trichinella pseudospiralis TaxID=6337 RepID=A0A0V1EBI0_TRIPS|nr:hypothetical protein T4A_6278 [Trichinella pseudospiralis]